MASKRIVQRNMGAGTNTVHPKIVHSLDELFDLFIKIKKSGRKIKTNDQ